MKAKSLRLETPWRVEIPELTKSERESLKADIEAHGIIYPVLIDENKSVIDGHNRVEIADELDIDVPTKKLEGLTTLQKFLRAIRANLHRRHLSIAQKKQLLEREVELEREQAAEEGEMVKLDAKKLAEKTDLGLSTTYRYVDPAQWKREAREGRRKTVTIKHEEGMSTREIGEELGVDQKTVVNDLKAAEEEFPGEKTSSLPLGICPICDKPVLPHTEHFRYGSGWIIQRVGGGPNRIAHPKYTDQYAHKACIT